jgi:sugar/nucleoside kinase (ribokinase family)
MAYDFVAIGDMTTDAFIRLKDAEEHVIDNTRELCLRFGEKVPYESVQEIRATGNAANAAVAASRLGLKSALVSWVGDDQNGQECRETLRGKGVSDEFVTVESGKKTNYHYVLMFGEERTILIKHEDFSYHLPANFEPPRYLYFSSVSGHAGQFEHDVAAWAKAHPETKLVFQPGTFQVKLGATELGDVISATELYFCNKEEARAMLRTEETDVKKLMEDIRGLGPKIVCVTDGSNGAYLLDDSLPGQGGAWHIPMFPDFTPAVNRTGAGDATASSTVAYISLGMKPVDALLRGLVNAAAVAQGVGAQTNLLSKDGIEDWYAKRPPEFKPEKMA